MQGQPVGTDLGIVDKATFDHQPTHDPLREKEQANANHMWSQRGGESTAHQTDEQGHGHDKPNDTAEKSVHKFWPENRLELGQAHTHVDTSVLRRLLICIELDLPLLR